MLSEYKGCESLTCKNIFTVTVSLCFFTSSQFVYLHVLQRAHRNIFPLFRGAAVLLSQTRSRTGHCICVLCITSCVRLWIVRETMVCFALKGHFSHLPLGCKRRHIQCCCSGTICIPPPSAVT